MLEGRLPLAALGSRTFDLVTLVDVIEHVTDPVGLCRDAAARLAPGGRIVVVTPDVESIAARVLGRRWWHFRVAHIGYFSPRSFSRAAERAGLRVVDRERARWYFPVGYLVDRTREYLPIPSLPALLAGANVVSRLREMVVPLNLFDSTVYYLGSNG